MHLAQKGEEMGLNLRKDLYMSSDPNLKSVGVEALSGR